MKFILSLLILILTALRIYMLSFRILIMRPIEQRIAKSLAILCSCVSFVLLYKFGLPIFLSLFNFIYEDNQEFNSSKWNSHVEDRYKMRTSLTEDILLQGKSKVEIFALVGPPDFRQERTANTDQVIGYHLGSETVGLWQLRIHELKLTISNDTVSEVELYVIND